MIIPREKIFPSVLILLDLFAAVGYIHTGNWRMVIYWVAAGILTAAVTW